MKPPTENQLNRIAAHGRLIDHDYTRKEASDIISQLVKSGEEPNWGLVNQYQTQELIAGIESRQIKACLPHLEQKSKQSGSGEWEKDQILCEIDELRDRLKDIAKEKRERARERIQELQESFGRDENGIHTEWSEKMKKPTQAQVRACVETLDKEHPDWENSMGLLPLFSTLLANYPNLERKARQATKKKVEPKGCLIVLPLLLVPLLVFICSMVF